MKKILIIVVVVLVAVDQLSKHWVEAALPFHEAVPVIPFFSLYRTHNTGIAFSMLDWLGAPGLSLITLLIIGFMIYLWRGVPRHKQLASLGYALVISGALGNLIDRITQGHVIDFFLVHTQTWAFAVFNVADSFITVGAICIIVDEVVTSISATRPPNNNKGGEPSS
ncbi:MAG: signal peptidase II [Pseudomonadota bacterium]